MFAFTATSEEEINEASQTYEKRKREEAGGTAAKLLVQRGAERCTEGDASLHGGLKLTAGSAVCGCFLVSVSTL